MKDNEASMNITVQHLKSDDAEMHIASLDGRSISGEGTTAPDALHALARYMDALVADGHSLMAFRERL